MGRLKVTFKIGLAYPFVLYHPLPDTPVVVTFQDTGNRFGSMSRRPGQPGKIRNVVCLPPSFSTSSANAVM